MASIDRTITQMVNHWIAIQINGYLGSSYGNTIKSLLHKPTYGTDANDLIDKLVGDIPVLRGRRDEISIYAVNTDRADEKEIVLDISGNQFLVGISRAEV